MNSAWNPDNQLDLAMWGLRTKMALHKTNPESFRERDEIGNP